MEYQVVPDEGGEPMSDVESIRQYYANHEHKVKFQSLLLMFMMEMMKEMIAVVVVAVTVAVDIDDNDGGGGGGDDDEMVVVVVVVVVGIKVEVEVMMGMIIMMTMEWQDNMIWRVANQSLLAQLLDELQQSLAGKSYSTRLTVSELSQVRLRISSFVSAYTTLPRCFSWTYRLGLSLLRCHCDACRQVDSHLGQTNFKVATVGVGKEPMLALAKLSGEVEE